MVPWMWIRNVPIARDGLRGGDARTDLGRKPGDSPWRFPFRPVGRAMALNEQEGMVKIVADRKYGELLGVHIIGPFATELIHEAVIAIKLEATVEELMTNIHAHPTLSEAIGEAALDVQGEAIHKLKK